MLDAKALAQAEQKARAKVLAWALADFRRFCGLVDIVPKSGKRMKLVLNEIQRTYCQNRTQRDVTLKPRQVGFTTLEQARDIYHFLTVPGARVVVTCQSITDHTPLKLLSNNYRVMFEGLQRAGLRLNFRTASTSEWVLADRDAALRIVEAGASEAAASKKGRAGTITRLHLTETAFYEYAEETLNAMLECVPGIEHGSEIISESTPNGAAGVFFQQCQDAKSGVSGYQLHFYPWFAVSEYSVPLDPSDRIEPRTERERTLVEQYGVRPEQLKWYRRKLSEKGSQELLDQEYPSDPETCFLVSGRVFFDMAVTNAMASAARAPIETGERGALRIWELPARGEQYIIGADTSEGIEAPGGKGSDASAAIVYRRRDGAHVATLHGHFTPWEFARALASLGRRYGNARVAVERNNHGHAVLQALIREHRYPNLYQHDDGRAGWITSAVTRPQMLDALEDGHRQGLWKSPDQTLLGEMRTFVVKANGRPEAARGAHDDTVLAAAIGWAVLTRPMPYRSFVALPPA